MTPLQSIRIKSHIADIDSANDRQYRGLKRTKPTLRQTNTVEYLSEPQVHDAIQRTDHHSYLVLVVRDTRHGTACELVERGLAHKLGLWVPAPTFLTPYLKTWSEAEINAYDAVR